VKAVVLAGGLGRRLAPYTTILPKPLMPLGDRSILEVTIDRLVQAGISDITLCVGYLAHLIEAVLEGSGLKAACRYVREDEPLGTAGPLRLVPQLDRTFLTMNGDLLTDIDFEDLVAHHRQAGNLVTIASHRRVHAVDYGVLVTGDDPNGRLVDYQEKPTVTYDVSMGIYVMEPGVLEHLPPSGRFDFPDLILRLLAVGEPVGTYLFEGRWLDIGRPDDYEQALQLFAERQLR
jgi:NDP-sugar pyrophosphorylase family protein